MNVDDCIFILKDSGPSKQMSQILNIFATFFNHLKRPSFSEKVLLLDFNLVPRVSCFFLNHYCRVKKRHMTLRPRLVSINKSNTHHLSFNLNYKVTF